MIMTCMFILQRTWGQYDNDVYVQIAMCIGAVW
jgi:hypothetical protein